MTAAVINAPLLVALVALAFLVLAIAIMCSASHGHAEEHPVPTFVPMFVPDPDPPTPQPKEQTHMKIHVYQDLRGEFRWRLVASNGRIVADGAEGYATFRNVMRALETIGLPYEVVDKTPPLATIPE